MVMCDAAARMVNREGGVEEEARKKDDISGEGIGKAGTHSANTTRQTQQKAERGGTSKAMGLHILGYAPKVSVRSSRTHAGKKTRGHAGGISSAGQREAGGCRQLFSS